MMMIMMMIHLTIMFVSSGGAADKDGMQLVMRITQSLQTLSKTLAGFGKEESSFRTNLNGLINTIQVKVGSD